MAGVKDTATDMFEFINTIKGGGAVFPYESAVHGIVCRTTAGVPLSPGHVSRVGWALGLIE